MKTLRKASFENFDRLSIVEASQLYGGMEDYPTTTLPTDSTTVNKNDSIPPTGTTPKITITGSSKSETNKSVTTSVGANVTTGSGWSFGGTVTNNTASGWSYGGTISYTFGGNKK